jgi:hypothetical protein
LSKQASGVVYEKRLAKIIGGIHIRRNSYGISAPDVEHDCLIVECKLRKDLALESWMQQVESHSEPGKTSIVVAKQKHLPDSRSIVAMRISDFLKLLDKAGP